MTTISQDDLQDLNARREALREAEEAEREAREVLHATDAWKAHQEALRAKKRAERAVQMREQLITLDYDLPKGNYRIDPETGEARQVDHQRRR